MTPKEFIDENYFSLTIDCKREINEIYQALKDYAKIEQLTLTDVVQQIEPLFCYHEGSYTLNKDGTCCKCHRLPNPKAK